MPRICMFMADFCGGGAERVMVNIANGLSDRGYDVDFVLARNEGPYRDLVSDQIGVYALSRRLGGSLLPFVKYLRKRRPLYIVAAGEHACIAAALCRAVSRIESRLILSIHNALDLHDAGGTDAMRIRFDHAMMAVFFPWADRVVTVTEGLRREAIRVLRIDEAKVVTIHNPIYHAEIESLAGDTHVHQWLNMEEGRHPVVIAVGRLSQQKGFDLLLQAFALVRKRMSALLIILGQGPDLVALRTMSGELGIDEYVHFAGFVANPYAHIARADVLAMTSRSEGFGNVLVEALAVGTQVVSTDCNYGPREILADGEYGTLVPPGDPVALAEGIIQSLQRPANETKLKERAKFFSVDAAVDKYENVIRSL